MSEQRLSTIAATPPRWISVTESLPNDFVSVIGHMTDAGEFPSTRECYRFGDRFFYPALNEIHPTDFWMPLPEPPKEEEDG